ncbi:MAG: DUF5691 domain-containing protein [Armatimonadota bacterium]
MDAWQQVVTSAVLGTDRQPLALPMQEGPLGAMLARLKEEDPARAVLGAAAAIALYRKTGAVPAIDPSAPPEPCAEEAWPACPERLRDLLVMLLGGQHAAALPECLALLAQHHLHVPDDLIPPLLAIGKQSRNCRQELAAVTGERGHWLAHWNPEWTYLLAESAGDAAGWNAEAFEERLAALRSMRRTNPARAQEALSAVWETEKPKERAALLATFEEGLGPEDEPFLETVLDDRRKEVRTVAAGLLARLNGSRMQRDMIERLRPLLALDPGQPARIFQLPSARKARLKVAMPDTCDKAMVRDGVELKVPDIWKGKLGDKAWWLLQMIGTVPPNHWCAAWQTTPEVIIAAAMESEWITPLLTGLIYAVKLHRASDWAKPLYSRIKDHISLYATADWGKAIDLLPVATREELALLSLLTAQTPKEMLDPLNLVDDSLPHWGEPLSTLLLQHLTRAATKHIFSQTHWSQDITYFLHVAVYFAGHAHPGVLDQGEQVLQRCADRELQGYMQNYWDKEMSKALGLLRFRLEMYRAVKP